MEIIKLIAQDILLWYGGIAQILTIIFLGGIFLKSRIVKKHG